MTVTQTKIRSSSGGSWTGSATFAAGDLLFATLNAFGETSASDSVKDTKNGSVAWTKPTGNAVTNSNAGISCHYFANSAAGTSTVTATLGSTTNGGVLLLADATGMATSSPVDTNPSTTNTGSGSPAVTNALTPATASTLVFGCYEDDGSGTSTASVTVSNGASDATGASWTMAGSGALGSGAGCEGNGNTYTKCGLAYKLESSALATQASFTSSQVIGNTVSLIVAFLQASSGGTPSSSDSATLTDTANQIGVNGPSDTGSESESSKIGTGSSDAATLAEQQAIALLNSDAAAFAEQVAITVTAATSDSATLTDSASANAGQVSKSDTDTAALTEQIKLALTATDSAQLGESMALALAHQDTATLQELVSVALAIADAASLAEGATVTAHASTSDSATLTDAGSVSQTGNSPSSSDSGTLGESSSSTAAIAQTDLGTLAEQAAIRLGATDLASLTEQIGLGLIAADNAALTEQLQVAVANAQTDSGSLAELQNVVTAILQVTDAAALGESATVQVFSGGQRDWVFVISAPTAKWSVQPPAPKWDLRAPSAKWTATAPQQ